MLIDPADAMNPQAQNAILKTLEEPPPETTLVLVSSSADGLLPTVRSRCLRLPFAPLPDALLEERLAAAGRSPEAARLAVTLAGGSLGKALLLDEEAMGARREAVLEAAALPADDARPWIAFAARHGSKRERAREVCELLLVWLRDVLARAAAGESAPSHSPIWRTPRPPRPGSAPRRRCAGSSRCAARFSHSATTPPDRSRSSACWWGGSMARPPARKKEPAPSLEDALAAIREGSPSPVYLLDGDAFLTLRAARTIADALVPEGQRSLNLVEVDGAAGPGEVASELATGGLFGGSKVVLVVEPAFLQSKEDLAGAFAKASDMWREGRQREAARRLVALAARLGWSTADLAGDAPPTSAEWEEKLQGDDGLRPEDGAFLSEAGRYAGEKNLQAARDDTSALEALLEKGLPPGHVLVLAAGKVDGRLPLVKRLAAAGCRIPVAIQSEGTWDAQRPVIGPLLAETLAGTGKTVDAGAEARLAALVGADARALAAEVAKLATFVGDRKVIRAEDVDALVVRTAADPFFALGNAVEARDLPGRWRCSAAASPTGRARTCWWARSPARSAACWWSGSGGGSPPAAAGSARSPSGTPACCPSIDPAELKERKPYGLWMKYQAALRFGREELLTGLASLAEADHSMKTGSDGAILVERWLVGVLGAPDRERRTA